MVFPNIRADLTLSTRVRFYSQSKRMPKKSVHRFFVAADIARGGSWLFTQPCDSLGAWPAQHDRWTKVFLAAKVNTDNFAARRQDEIRLWSSILRKCWDCPSEKESVVVSANVKVMKPARGGRNKTLWENRGNSVTLLSTHKVCRGWRSGRGMGQQNVCI